ncbi:MAG: sulfatase-like hydrolase/transferase [Armatimonadetes bacterium]|nr:sulfatase-like hydrolase/transferase [Armatimonadota bacterium]
MAECTRRDVLRSLGLGGLTLALAGRVGGQAAVGGRKPNIVILLADDLGWGDVGCYGGRDIPTPNLDALAASGARFTNAYSSGPVCSPTRAGLMTGRYQQRFGFDANAEGQAAPTDRGPRALDIAQTTIAQRLRQAGYATGLVGKWHLGPDPGYLPNDRGFDEFYGYLPYGLAAKGPGGGPLPIYRDKQQVETPANHMAQFGREAQAFIERHQAAPFFLYLAFSAVHGPMVGPEPYLSKFKDIALAPRRKYAADLNQLDDIVGQVLAKIAALGLAEDTLVFFLGDNGGPGRPADNGPLRGTKWTLWEGGIRVPFAVRWKGRIPAGQTLDQPIIQLDIVNTALAAAGAEVKTTDLLDGADLLPLVAGKSPAAPHDALYWRFGVQYAVRQGDWKLVKPHIDQQPHLFNLAQDIGESIDLAAKEPARVKAMQAVWDSWNALNEPPRWIDRRWNGDGPGPAKPPARRPVAPAELDNDR